MAAFYEYTIGLSISIVFCWTVSILHKFRDRDVHNLCDPFLDTVGAIIASSVAVMSHRLNLGHHIEVGFSLASVWMFVNLSTWVYWHYNFNKTTKLMVSLVLLVMLIKYDQILGLVW
jgi:hypothetical protein